MGHQNAHMALGENKLDTPVLDSSEQVSWSCLWCLWEEIVWFRKLKVASLHYADDAPLLASLNNAGDPNHVWKDDRRVNSFKSQASAPLKLGVSFLLIQMTKSLCILNKRGGKSEQETDGWTGS